MTFHSSALSFRCLFPLFFPSAFLPNDSLPYRTIPPYLLLAQGWLAFHLTNSLFLPLNTYSILYRCFPRVLKGVSRRNNRIKLPSTMDKPAGREKKKRERNKKYLFAFRFPFLVENPQCVMSA